MLQAFDETPGNTLEAKFWSLHLYLHLVYYCSIDMYVTGSETVTRFRGGNEIVVLVYIVLHNQGVKHHTSPL